jgi:polyhydroxyalkanoate synthesis regulator phasin
MRRFIRLKISEKQFEVIPKEEVKEAKKEIEDNLHKLGRIIREKKKITGRTKLMLLEAELQKVEKELLDLDEKLKGYR